MESIAIAKSGLTQVAAFSTTIYLHRGVTHRALLLHSGDRVVFPVRALDHYRPVDQGVRRSS